MGMECFLRWHLSPADITIIFMPDVYQRGKFSAYYPQFRVYGAYTNEHYAYT